MHQHDWTYSSGCMKYEEQTDSGIARANTHTHTNSVECERAKKDPGTRTRSHTAAAHRQMISFMNSSGGIFGIFCSEQMYGANKRTVSMNEFVRADNLIVLFLSR